MSAFCCIAGYFVKIVGNDGDSSEVITNIIRIPVLHTGNKT